MPQFYSFFTTERSDAFEIAKWLEQNDLGYFDFYASFLNHAIARGQRSKNPRSKDSITPEDNAILEVLQDFPAQTQGFLDAMQSYARINWAHGIKQGEINLRDGRLATLADLERAHVKLATLLFTKAERAQYKAQRPQIAWLESKSRAFERKARKNARRAERAAVKGIAALELEGGDEVEDPMSPESPLPESDSMSLAIRTRKTA